MTRPIPPAEAERCSRCGRLLTDPPLSWDPTSGSLDGCHIPPAEQQRDVNRGLCPICRDVLRAREDSPDAPRECPRHGRPIPPGGGDA